MATRINREIKQYIFDEMGRLGSIRVDDVAAIIRPLGLFDPAHAEELWYKEKARRLLASRRNDAGTRTVFAVDKGDGKFIDIRSAGQLNDVKSVIRQLTTKRDGINVSLKEATRRKTELEGQISLFDSSELGKAATSPARPDQRDSA